MLQEPRCYHCSAPLQKTSAGKINKLFCCQAHQRAYYETRRAARRLPKADRRKAPRYCECEGCSNKLARHQKRFCSVFCYTTDIFGKRDPDVYRGVPERAMYTAAQAADVRRMFFDMHLSLRGTACQAGVSLGKVTRIIYAKNAPKGGAQR
jgi:hypothetical protein